MMFWKILFALGVADFIVLLLCFIPVFVFVIGYILGKDIDDAMEKRFPKIYRAWGKIILGTLLGLLVTFVPASIHNVYVNQSHEYKVEVGDDEVKVTDTNNGETYTFIIGD